MKSVDFCYWLQGWFELFTPEKISSEQVKTIKAHLDLVYEHNSKEMLPFCAELQGLFQFTSLTEFDEVLTQKIKERLSDTFLNHIDSRYSPHQHALLDTIHSAPMFSEEWSTTDDNGNKLPPGVRAKC